jgi:hypothetical protein
LRALPSQITDWRRGKGYAFEDADAVDNAALNEPVLGTYWRSRLPERNGSNRDHCDQRQKWLSELHLFSFPRLRVTDNNIRSQIKGIFSKTGICEF